MKKIFFILCLSAVLFSCQKDEEQPQFEPSLLVGDWELIDLEYSGTSETSFMDQTISLSFVGKFYEGEYILNFTENPNLFQAEGSYTIELTTDFGGLTSTAYESIEDLLIPGEWEIVGDKILISNDFSGSSEARIVELTESSLVLSVEQNYQTTQDDVTVSSEVNGTFILSRIL